MNCKTYWEVNLSSIRAVDDAFQIFIAVNPRAVVISVSHTFETDNTYSIFILYKEI